LIWIFFIYSLLNHVIASLKIKPGKLYSNVWKNGAYKAMKFQGFFMVTGSVLWRLTLKCQGGWSVSNRTEVQLFIFGFLCKRRDLLWYFDSNECFWTFLNQWFPQYQNGWFPQSPVPPSRVKNVMHDVKSKVNTRNVKCRHSI